MALPWDEVNAIDSQAIANLLGLERAAERSKYECVSCDSSDGLHAYPSGRGFFCWSCRTSFSNVDAVARQRGIEAWEACVLLAAQYLGYTDDDGARHQGDVQPKTLFARRSHLSLRDEALQKLPSLEGPRYPHEIYAEILRLLPLTPAGAQFLGSRGFDPTEAYDYGFRSIDGRQGWDALSQHLRKLYRPTELQAACFPYMNEEEVEAKGFAKGTKKLHMLWGGFLPYVFMPYWHENKVRTLRFAYYGEDRGKKDAASRKYLSLREGGIPEMPFGADAIGSRHLHVVEGELNSYTLSMRPYRQNAISVGASTYWRAEWVPLLAQSKRLIVWYDTDRSGNAGYELLSQQIANELGTAVADRLIHRMTDLPKRTGPDGQVLTDKEGNAISKDPNELHLDGTLRKIVMESPWISRAR